MTQALQRYEPQDISASDFETMQNVAKTLVSTGFLPQSIKTPEQAIAIILTGRELGVGTMAALNSINVIQGKPTVSPQLMLAMIERSGQLADIQIEPHDGNAVRCTMKRKGRSPHTEIFGDAEAQAMQLAGKDNYKKQAQTMYRWRAVAACARVVFPDVVLGLYTPDEMGADVNDDGEILAPVKNNIRPISDAASQTVDGEIVQEEAKLSVADICKQLKAAGDEVDWNQATLHEYAETLFGNEYKGALNSLTDEQKTFLAEDLGERLKEFQTRAAAAA